jgi:hypothetical protein
MACACTSPPVWLGTTELTNLQVNLTPGPGLRLFWADCFGKACFATDLGFKEIHVDARAGYVMAARGAGGAAGPAPRHQPSESGKAIYIYCDYFITCKHAGSVVVKAAGCYAHDCGFVPSSLQYFFFLYFLFMAKWNCTCHVCTWYIHGLNMYAHKHTYKYLYIRVYTRSEHCMNEILAFIIVYTCLYMIHTWHRLGCTYDIHVCTCLIVVHNKNMEKHSVLSVLPEVYNFILACTAHVRCMYYAIVH